MKMKIIEGIRKETARSLKFAYPACVTTKRFGLMLAATKANRLNIILLKF